MSTPTVALTPKVAYSFKMLSALLDRLSQTALEDISQRREFFVTSRKRRDKIIRAVASLPLLVRTVLLIESPAERDALLQTSIVKNAIFCVESGNVCLYPRRSSLYPPASTVSPTANNFLPYILPSRSMARWYVFIRHGVQPSLYDSACSARLHVCTNFYSLFCWPSSLVRRLP